MKRLGEQWEGVAGSARLLGSAHPDRAVLVHLDPGGAEPQVLRPRTASGRHHDEPALERLLLAGRGLVVQDQAVLAAAAHAERDAARVDLREGRGGPKQASEQAGAHPGKLETEEGMKTAPTHSICLFHCLGVSDLPGSRVSPCSLAPVPGTQSQNP
jgi:hypothetical protein